MKRIILLCVALSVFFLSGCYSYNDMNRVYFATMSISDIKEDDTIVFYEEYFASDRGNTEQGGLVTRIVLKQEGKTHIDVYANLNNSATYPIIYDVKRAIGFTEDMARNGIDEVVDSLERDQNRTNKVFLFICGTEPEEFFKVQMEDEKFLGVWLEDIFIFQEEEARVLSIRANDYLNERLKGSRVSVLPIIDIINHPVEKRLCISGAAVMKENKMIDKLELDEIPIYKTLFNRDKNLMGGFETIYPNTETKISISILKRKVKEKFEMINGELTLVYDIKTICSIAAVEGELDLLDARVREGVIKAAEDTIKQEGENFYKKYQKRGIDILDVEVRLKRRFNNLDIGTVDENTFRNVKVVINPTVMLDGGQNTSNTVE